MGSESIKSARGRETIRDTLCFSDPTPTPMVCGTNGTLTVSDLCEPPLAGKKPGGAGRIRDMSCRNASVTKYANKWTKIQGKKAPGACRDTFHEKWELAKSSPINLHANEVENHSQVYPNKSECKVPQNANPFK